MPRKAGEGKATKAAKPEGAAEKPAAPPKARASRGRKAAEKPEDAPASQD